MESRDQNLTCHSRNYLIKYLAHKMTEIEEERSLEYNSVSQKETLNYESYLTSQQQLLTACSDKIQSVLVQEIEDNELSAAKERSKVIGNTGTGSDIKQRINNPKSLVKLAMHVKHQRDSFKRPGLTSKQLRHMAQGDIDPIEPTSFVEVTESQDSRYLGTKRELLEKQI